MAGDRISAGLPPPAEEKTKLMIAVNKSNIDSSRHCALSSGEAFDWTLKKIIRNNFTDFKLILIHVQPQSCASYFFSLLRSKTYRSLISNESPESCQRIQFLEDIKKKCRDIGIVCEEHIMTGDPKKQICDAVESFKPDLLIVGNRDLTAFQKLFNPHVSEYCAKHAECPVVRIKRKVETVGALDDRLDD